MKAVLNIEGSVFCSIEIEGAEMPSAANLIDTIMILEGFSMGLPVLKMELNDYSGTLSSSLNLGTGSVINIQLGKNAEEAPIRSFRVFGWGRPRGGIRNKISLVALYNAPKFSSGAFAESYEGPTSTVMGEIAAASGLEYDGPSRP